MICDTKPARRQLSDPAEKTAELAAAYEERAHFRLAVRANKVDEQGSCRMECPARAGRVRCPLVDMRLPVDKPQV